jgi:hypothetical protein
MLNMSTIDSPYEANARISRSAAIGWMSLVGLIFVI